MCLVFHRGRKSTDLQNQVYYHSLHQLPTEDKIHRQQETRNIFFCLGFKKCQRVMMFMIHKVFNPVAFFMFYEQQNNKH